MASIPGSVPLSGKVAPTDTTDTFATHVDIYGEGGYMTVANTTERDAITTERRKQGMAVFVNDTNEMYILQDGVTNADWVLFSGGGGGDLQATMNLGSTATVTTDVDIRTSGDVLFNCGSTPVDQFDIIGGNISVQSGYGIDIDSTAGDIKLVGSGLGSPSVGDMLVAKATSGAVQWAPGVQSIKRNISDAEVQSLHSTPVNVIAIPAGKRLQVLSAMAYLNIAYTNNRTLILYYDGCNVGGGPANTAFRRSFFTGMPDNTGAYLPVESGSGSLASWGNNCNFLKVTLDAASGAPQMTPAGGIDLYITYLIIDP